MEFLVVQRSPGLFREAVAGEQEKGRDAILRFLQHAIFTRLCGRVTKAKSEWRTVLCTADRSAGVFLDIRALSLVTAVPRKKVSEMHNLQVCCEGGSQHKESYTFGEDSQG